jgi:hypothetical protein
MNETTEIQRILGVSVPFKIGTSVTQLHPIQLKDWPGFRECIGVLEHLTLFELYFFSDAETLLNRVIKLAGRLGEEEEIPPMFSEMTQLDYEKFRTIVVEQNGINFDDFKKKLEALRRPLALPKG